MRDIGLQRGQGRRQVRRLEGDWALGQLLKTQLDCKAVRILVVEMGGEDVLRLLDGQPIDLLIAVEHGPLRLLQRQTHGQAYLGQGFLGQQRSDRLVGGEIDAEIAGDALAEVLPPLLQGIARRYRGLLDAGLIGHGGGEARRQWLQALYLVAQRGQLDELPGPVQIGQLSQRLLGIGHLLACVEGRRIVLRLEDVIDTLQEILGAGHVLQGSHAQGRHAQQMLGLGQAPGLATLADHLLELFGEVLLITLQGTELTTAFFQLVGRRQACQIGAQRLVAYLQLPQLAAQVLGLGRLSLFVLVYLLQLPDTPAAHSQATSGYQQGQQRETGRLAGALAARTYRRRCRWWRDGSHDRIGRDVIGAGGLSFAHGNSL